MPVADILMRSQRQQSQPLSSLAQGMQYGQQINQMQAERAKRNALEQLGPRASAGDPEAINQMAAVDPKLSAQYAERATARRQSEFNTVGRLLEGVQTEQGYQNALSMAEQMGVSPKTLGGLKQAMPQFDPGMAQRLTNMYGRAGGAEYSKSLTPAFNERGEPVFVQPSSAGGARVVQGYRPNLLTPEQKTQQEARRARMVAEAKESTPMGQAKRSAAEAQAEQARTKTEEAKQTKLKGDRVRKRALNLVDSLLSPDRKEAMEAATGTIESRLPTLSQDTKDFEVDLEALSALLTSENLDMMSGVLSESDIKILRDVASGGLDLAGGAPRLRNRLNEIGRSLKEGLGQSQFSTPQAVQSASADELRKFVSGATPEQLDNLPGEVRSAIAEKLQGGR